MVKGPTLATTILRFLAPKKEKKNDTNNNNASIVHVW